MDRNTFIKIRAYFMLDARKRTAYLIRKKIFDQVGENFVFFPRKIPQDPQFIRFCDNVVVATDVMFVNHDIIHEMFNGIKQSYPPPGEGYQKHWGCIEIKDNVFIGARSIIMPGVALGPNVVVAAGSVVTKDFSGDVVIGGNPAKVIGDMNSLKIKRAMGHPQASTKEQEALRQWSEWKK